MTVTRESTPAGELEREPMCRIEWCPFPSSPEFHECWCGRLDVEHHHVDPRGMGGSPERRDDPDNIQCVCPPHHKAVHVEGYTDEIADGYYIVQNPKGSRIVKHPRYQSHGGSVLSAAAEGEGGPVGPAVETPTLSTAAPSAGSDGAEARGGSTAEYQPRKLEITGSNPVPDKTSAPSPSAESKEEGDGQSDGARVREDVPEGEARGDTATGRPARDVAGGGDGGRGGPLVDRGDGNAFASLTQEQPLSDDWADMSDEQLQALYEAAEQRQGMSFLVKCKAVWTFKERHEVWNEAAYERFGASRRTLYAYANIWAICVTSDTHVIEQIGKLTDSKSLMQSIGRRSLEDGAAAMEAAVAHYAVYGEAPTVAALGHRLGVEQGEERERHACPGCGQEHAVKP